MIAIAADDLEDMAALQTNVSGITLLTDLALTGISAWGALQKGAEHPSPATFVVGSDGLVRWRRVLDARGDWPTYAELAGAL